MVYKMIDLESCMVKVDISINKFLVERVEEEIKGIEVIFNKVVIDVERFIKDVLFSGILSIF